MGTAVHSRSLRITSRPSMSGRPRSRMTTSGWRVAAASSASAPGVRLEEPVALADERGAQESPDGHLVLDDEDGRVRHRPEPGPSRGAG